MKPKRWAFVNTSEERTAAVIGYEAWEGTTGTSKDAFEAPAEQYRTTDVQGTEGHERVTTGLV